MSKVVEAAVAALDEKAKGFDGTAKFVIEGEGAVYIDADGARAADDEAEVTLTASRETFEGLMSGDVNPTTAFMTGKLRALLS
ncbi:SCP2 sterol-binding domain-containing protein [Paracoccus sp. (in: a-proteobacteria)]|uniref:SCP2 sterol-binding domain-containing protein n=1 Tax=Paracoccus sp. TaxID=267 RepID=UPI0028B2378C|nr:SCP2 sterol-binding domain-containing protein [Paracoccus sp. (in: a-proteobacteria)]